MLTASTSDFHPKPANWHQGWAARRRNPLNPCAEVLRRRPTTTKSPVHHFLRHGPIPATMGKRHRPEAVISGRAIRPAISQGKPGATHVHPMTRIGTTSTNLDLFPISIYIPRNGNLLPAASDHQSLHPPVLPARLYPHRPVAAAARRHARSACAPETMPPSPRLRRCCRSTRMRPISPPSASPLGPRPRRCCGCSAKTLMTSGW